jgi:diaminohydroxyphosphoribosylaminopyrimidine deaminase / 5-amino-6-(5-phosphoribosylamino)uracil reductase
MASKKTTQRGKRKLPRTASVPSPARPVNGPRENEEAFLQYALELARAGLGLTSPNPCVGAVVVDRQGRLVGEGSHRFEGIKHAEVLALEQAGKKARGGILYVSFEPCSHQ